MKRRRGRNAGGRQYPHSCRRPVLTIASARAEYRSIYGYCGLYRYGIGTQPSIHIIVDNGHVTLVGVVDNQADKDVANIRANAVPGVFSVTNNLRVAEKS